VPAPTVFATPAAAKAALAPADPWTPGTIELNVPGKVARDVVLVLWPTDDIYDIGQARRLNLLSDALKENIRIRLREELGQAYSPSASHSPGDGWIGWGQMAVSASVAHGAAEGALKALDGVVANLRDHVIDADTFARIRTPLLAQLPALRKRNDWWLGTVLTNAAIQPFRLDWSKSLETDYAAITTEELRDLARKFLVDARRIVVIGRCAGAPEAK
jgi:zinc protease